MRWTPGGTSEDLEDRRGETGGRGVRRGGAIGIGGLLLLLVVSWATGTNFLSLLGPALEQGIDTGANPSSGPPAASSPEEDQRVQFVSFVLDDAQRTWQKIIPDRYEKTRLVLFRDAIQSACGFAESASGPFYCPGDRKVYIDLGFYDELRQRFKAAGDFAEAYVLAHEIGHHVQTLLDIEPHVRQMQQRRPDAANQLSVRLELQADCFAGVWGHSTAERSILEQGDVEEGLNAAASIGDDRIQRMSTGYVHPEAFTHGSSEQRVQWFRRGLEQGTIQGCDTFGGT
jgi:predicted metalloprotease